ncbi:MAG: ParA family protein [Alphaproteobacteria bacterium]|nr:ParA family protein [Alphaproteobacteria bacterium]
MPTVAVFNQKGGVAKTTTAVNLAALWARRGHKTLLVDMDAQGNATAAFGITPRPLKGVYDLLVEAATVDEVIRPTAMENLKILPSTPNLSGLDVALSGVMEPQLVLRRALETPAAEAEYIVIDCPPTLGLPSVNALVAASELVIPTFCYRHAQDGLHATWANVRRMSRRINPVLRINGVLLISPESNEVSRRTADIIRAEFGERIYDQAIPGDNLVPLAEESDMPVVLLHPNAPASKAYEKVVDEIDRRIYNASRTSVRSLDGGDEENEKMSLSSSSWLSMIEGPHKG